MRKALQAEQSKAQKLNMLALLQQTCAEEEARINDLKLEIQDKLREERALAEQAEVNHQEALQAYQEKCLAQKQELKKKLLALNVDAK